MSEQNSDNDDAEENYFVSLSDLMTGVVFIFVILLCAFAFHYQTESQTAKSQKTIADTAIADAKAAAASAAQSKNAADKAEADAHEKERKIDALSKLLRERDDALQRILSELVEKLAARGVRVLFDPATGVIRLPEELLFDRGSDVLSESGKQGLAIVSEELVPVLRRGCEERSPFRLEAVFIEGHTDNDPIRSAKFSDNWDLSARRATNTYRALVTGKPELKTFNNPAKEPQPVLGVSGYGETRPAKVGTTDEIKKLNRRVDLRFLMAHPTEEELKRAQEELNRTPESSATFSK